MFYIVAQLLKMKSLLSILTLLGFVTILNAQENIELDTSEIFPDTFHLNASNFYPFNIREEKSEIPLAISKLGAYRLQKGEQQLTLVDAFNSIPGVYAQGGENFKDDLRLSIRGFGTLDLFNMRGIKVISDGFSETTPDGLTSLENIDPSAIENIEVIRTNVGALYGNASKGLVHFSTHDFSKKTRIETGYRLGSFGFQKYTLKSVNNIGKLKYSIKGSGLSRIGYRKNSDVSRYIFNGGLLLPIDSTFSAKLFINYLNNPRSGEPEIFNGQINAQNNPMGRDSDNYEKASQGRIGINLEKTYGHQSNITLSGFQTIRNDLFDNGESFIENKRNFTGLKFAWNHDFGLKKIPFEFSMGGGMEEQHDISENYFYVGTGGDTIIDKRIISSVGNNYAFAHVKTTFTELLHFHISARYDHFDYIFENEIFGIGNKTPQVVKSHDLISTNFGFNASLDRSATLFINYATAFDAPVFYELLSPSQDSLNQIIEPDRTTTREFGIRTSAEEGHLIMDFSIYWISSEKEIIRQPVPDNIFRYRNLGRTDRKGLELNFEFKVAKNTFAFSNYTVAFYEYQKSDPPTNNNIADHPLPGIPRHHIRFDLRHQPKYGLFWSLNFWHLGSRFPDNQNNDENKVSAENIFNARIGYSWKRQKLDFELFGGANNLTNRSYFSNITNNSQFETAPKRNIFFGFLVKFQ